MARPGVVTRLVAGEHLPDRRAFSRRRELMITPAEAPEATVLVADHQDLFSRHRAAIWLRWRGGDDPAHPRYRPRVIDGHQIVT